MSLPNETNRNGRNTDFTMRSISIDEQQTVISFRAQSDCSADEVEYNYKTIVGEVLKGRDTIVVTKEDRLMDLISGAVDAVDQNYVRQNAFIVKSFVPKPESDIKHYATFVKKMPLSVAKDLANSSEFIFGNLWFLVPSGDADDNQCGKDVIDDVRKLTAYILNQFPILHCEAVASPAMYDGLEILWFKPNKDVYQNVISPLFKN